MKSFYSILRIGYFISITAFLLTPVLIIIPMSFGSGRYLEFPPSDLSFRWYIEFFESVDWKSSAVTSLQVAFMTTVLSLLLGLPASFAIAKSKKFIKRFFTVFFSLPMIFPIIISAVSIYYLFAPLHLVGNILGLVIAHTILALPVVIIPIVGAINRLDKYLEWQAQNLGATYIQTLYTVILPILKPVISIVALFAFITSFDEIIFAIFLSGGSTTTLPKKIWEGLRFEIEPTVAVVATFTILFSSVVIACAIFLNKKYHFFN